MAKVKIGDIVKITSGISSGVICYIDDICCDETHHGHHLYFLSPLFLCDDAFISGYYRDEFEKVGA